MSENQLSPAEQKRQNIIEAASRLVADLLGTHIDQACIDATESFAADDEASEPVVKIGFTVQFEPQSAAPEVAVKIAWSARRSDEAVEVVNDQQLKLADIIDPKAKAETPGDWLRQAKAKEAAR